MKWVSGMRSGILYTIESRPLDPRWSQKDLQVFLGNCVNGQALGWEDERAFNTAEAIIIRQKNHGIFWSNTNLNNDIAALLKFTELSITRK